MIALKVAILAVVVLSVNASTEADDSNESPSSANKLPSDQNRPNTQPIPHRAVPRKGTSEQDILGEKGAVPETVKQKVPEVTKPHRLSKRFISSRWSLKRGGLMPEASLGRWSTADVQSPADRSLSSRLTYYDTPTDQDVLDFMLRYDKPKRFFGLLPAKEPRRKDLPPRLGEESAPRFARAFSYPEDPQEPPSVRTTLSDLLRNLKKFNSYRGQLRKDYLSRERNGKLLSQNFKIDTPININHVDVDFGMDDDIYSDLLNTDSVAYLSSDSDFDQESSSSDVDESEGSEDSGGDLPAPRKEDLDKFKDTLHKLLSHIQGVTQENQS